MKKRATILALAAFAIALPACGLGNGSSSGGEAHTPAQRMRSRLIEAQKSGTLIGHHDDPVYGHNWNGDAGRSDILETAGDYPAMMSWDLGALELGKGENLDGVPFERIREEIRRQDARGGFNTLSWHFYSPVDSTDCWTIGDSLTVRKILTDPSVNSTFRGQVRQVADFIGNLADDKGHRIPVIFRPLHEHTGNWFWWGKPYATSEEYVTLWKIIADEMKDIDNVLFAYSTDRIASAGEYLEYYPGDDIIDILGVDIYHFNGADGLADYVRTSDKALSEIAEIGKEKGKIMAFTETGSEGIPLQDWWTATLLPLLKSHRPAYVVLWRNAHDRPGHYYVPFPGHPSEASFKEFCNDPNILLIKDMK